MVYQHLGSMLLDIYNVMCLQLMMMKNCTTHLTVLYDDVITSSLHWWCTNIFHVIWGHCKKTPSTRCQNIFGIDSTLYKCHKFECNKSKAMSFSPPSPKTIAQRRNTSPRDTKQSCFSMSYNSMRRTGVYIFNYWLRVGIWIIIISKMVDGLLIQWILNTKTIFLLIIIKFALLYCGK